MTERGMQTLFGKYLKTNPPKETEVYELKISKHSSLPFASVKSHQIEALLLSETKFLYHRITDQPWMKQRNSYTLKKPFDCFCLVNAKAYLIFWFYKARQRKKFIKVGIKRFIWLKINSTRKSFTEKMILDIADSVISI